MKRIYERVLASHLAENRQMVFLAGPRQVGKTTCSFSAKNLCDTFHYVNWDSQAHRQMLTKGPDEVAKWLKLEYATPRMPIVVFDEIHKYTKWKQFLKGFYDLYSQRIKIIVTGSAKLNIYKAGGDSLMGRYFLYRIHPLSVGECLGKDRIDNDIQPPSSVDQIQFDHLYNFGGFPEPFLKHDQRFANRWHRLRQQQMIREDIRELSQIQELDQLEILAQALKACAGQLINYTSLANFVNVSVPTVQRWVKSLESFYYCFRIKPWFKNVKRSLRKEPKIYLWDWSELNDQGAKYENFIASHLLKAVHYWNDLGFGEYGLYYLRDKEKREVDFLITKNSQPWFLVEAKLGDNHGVSKSLRYFHEQVQTKHAFQVISNLPCNNIDCFSYDRPVIVPANTFLSQLV